MNATPLAIRVWRGFLASVLTLLPVLTFGQDKPASRTAEVEKRFAETVEFRFDQPYAGNTNPKQMVDVYLPKQRVDERPLPVVVYIHGGGWSGGDRKGYVAQAASLVSTGKYAAVAVGYRLSGEAKWPSQIHDCKAAIRWIRGHAKPLNLDPDKIGVTGSSAGGHLVSLLGVSAGVAELEGSLGEFPKQSSAVTCVVNFCGPTDLARPLMQGEAAKKDDPAVAGLVGGSLTEKAAEVKAASPVTYVSKSAAPIMHVHGTKDGRVNFEQAELLHGALTKAGASSLLIPVTDAGHGIPVGPELAGRIQKFWDLHLRGEKADISSAPIPATSK